MVHGEVTAEVRSTSARTMAMWTRGLIWMFA